MMQELRCSWTQSDPIKIAYHDQEWGIPSYDDTYLFELLNLEGAQAGLSWITILKKREGYRKTFHHFNINQCASLSNTELCEILATGEIIRNRLKVEAVRNNAIATQKIQESFGSFSDYIWQFTDFQPIVNHWTSTTQTPVQNTLSEKISKDLKQRGFKFVGPIIIYSYLQAIGIIDDHVITCPFHTENRNS